MNSSLSSARMACFWQTTSLHHHFVKLRWAWKGGIEENSHGIIIAVIIIIIVIIIKMCCIRSTTSTWCSSASLKGVFGAKKQVVTFDICAITIIISILTICVIGVVQLIWVVNLLVINLIITASLFLLLLLRLLLLVLTLSLSLLAVALFWSSITLPLWLCALSMRCKQITRDRPLSSQTRLITVVVVIIIITNALITFVLHRL